MDQGPESKKPRLSSTGSWPTGPATAHLHHGSYPNHNPGAASPQAPHPTPSGPYQPSHPFSRPSDPPPVSSPAPPTPNAAHSYPHLPPPQPTPQPHQPRASHPPPPHQQQQQQHYADDRQYHDPDQHASMQDHRQDYRTEHRSDYRQEHRPDYHQDQRLDYRQQEYRHPAPSSARPSPPYGASYGREQQMSEDSLSQIRRLDPGPVHAPPHPPPPPQQQPPQTLLHPQNPQHHLDDNRRQMNFDNIAHPPASSPHQLPNHQQVQSPNHNHQPPSQPNTNPHGHSAVPASQPQAPPPSLPPPPPQSSGPSVSVSSMYRPQSSYPPTPTGLSQPQQFEPPLYSHPQPSLQAPDQAFPVSYAGAGKKKAQRASQACDSCRSLKAKCDETKPCKNCREKNIECKYRDPIPKQQDKVTIDIMEAINTLDSTLRGEIREVRGELKTVVGNIEQLLAEMQSTIKLGIVKSDRVSHNGLARNSSPKQTSPWMTNMELAPEEAQRISEQLQNEDHMDVVPGPAVPPGEPAIPAYHTTLASLLLTWPTIRERVEKHLEAAGIRFPSEFPVRQEERRGAISFYGRGEDSVGDKGRGDLNMDPNDVLHIESSKTATAAHDFPSSNRSSPQGTDSFNNMPDSADSGRESWNQGGLNSPSPVDYMKGTPTRVTSELDLNPDRVWEYVHSYESNVQNIHPLIPSRDLRVMVTIFLQNAARTSGSQAAKPWAPVAEFAGGADSPMMEGGGLKRKRSPVQAGEGTGPLRQLPPRSGPRFQDVDSMLVLMVLALGKICLHKHGKLPDVVSDSDDEAASSQSPQPQNGYSPSLVHDSPMSVQQSSSRNGPSRRSSMQGGAQTQYPAASRAYSMKRNVDQILGFDYFVEACDRVGSHVGGRPQLKLVWIYILMCLYYSQLGRPIQSLEFVVCAGRQLQILLRPLFHKFGLMKKEVPKTIHRRENQMLFAFWTCLQLESDLLAELPLPQSGILAYEHQMPYPFPDISSPDGFDEYVLQSYMAQLFLRNQLNDIHKNLYDGRQDPNMIKKSQIMIFTEALDKDLWVPSLFKFSDEDPPANEILAARLRAKYWGAQVIIHRFFIRRILDYNYAQRMRGQNGGSGTGAGGQQSAESPLTAEAIQLARRGVRALIESTRAFHGLPDKRFIVTNVFGTAHAQWGNLLVLDSVQRDPVLGQFIDDEFLNGLFRKTIDFFGVIAQPKSALAYDMRILKGLLRDRLNHSQRNSQADPVTSPATPVAPPFSSSFMSNPSPSTVPATLPPSGPAARSEGYAHASQQQQQQQQIPMPQSHSQTSSTSTGSFPGGHSPQPPSQQGVYGQQPQSQPLPRMQDSPMQMTLGNTPPLFTTTTQGPSPPGPGLMHAPPPMISPVQGSLYPPQVAAPSVKGPSTPSESGFPHHLPPFDQPRRFRGSD